ncbi:MAG: tetratricopeptide repeat protein [Ferruginibacter sp.]
MSNNTSQTERLISYIDGDMGDDEKNVLQQQLQADKAMQQELDNLLLATDVVKNHGLANKVANIHTKMMSKMSAASTQPKAIVRSLPKLVMKYAAGIILLIGMFGLYQYFTVSSDKLYSEQYTAYTLTTVRGNETLPAIEKAYSEKKYDEVITVFKQLTDASVKENFVAGQAYMAKANYAEAVNCFKTVLEKNNNNHTGLLSDDAEYYLALSYLKNNEGAEALPLFKKIHNNKTHFYNNKVSSWFLKKLQLLNWKQ